MNREAWHAAVHGGLKELDTTEQLNCLNVYGQKLFLIFHTTISNSVETLC